MTWRNDTTTLSTEAIVTRRPASDAARPPRRKRPTAGDKAVGGASHTV